MALDRGRAEVAITEDAGRWAASAKITELSGTIDGRTVALDGPAELSSHLREDHGRLVVEAVHAKTGFLDAEGRGTLEDGIRLAGTLDLSGMKRQFGPFFDLGDAEIAGRGTFSAELRRRDASLSATVSSAFESIAIGPESDALRASSVSIEGSISAGSWRGTLSLQSAEKAGLRLGPAKVAASGKGGAIAFEPIETTLNGGALKFTPEVVDGPSGRVLKVRPGASLTDAEVNEESAHRVLAFVSPVLDRATEVSGRVSARLDRGEFPLGPDAAKTAVVEGRVVFQDVVFSPGPLGAEVLGLMGREEGTLRLDQPVVLAIADGKVTHRGLYLPVGKVAKVEFDGSVGLDRSLDLRASVPLTPEMFPGGGIVGDVMAGTRLTVPIGGTLDRPKLDREAFRKGLAEAGKGVLERGAVRGAAELLFRLTRPKDPNAPPPPSAEERRAQRLERRRMRREGPG